MLEIWLFYREKFLFLKAAYPIVYEIICLSKSSILIFDMKIL